MIAKICQVFVYQEIKDIIDEMETVEESFGEKTQRSDASDNSKRDGPEVQFMYTNPQP